MEARRLRPLIRPHCPRRNQCSPIKCSAMRAARRIRRVLLSSSASWEAASPRSDRTYKTGSAYKTAVPFLLRGAPPRAPRRPQASLSGRTRTCQIVAPPAASLSDSFHICQKVVASSWLFARFPPQKHSLSDKSRFCQIVSPPNTSLSDSSHTCQIVMLLAPSLPDRTRTCQIVMLATPSQPDTSRTCQIVAPPARAASPPRPSLAW